MHDFGRVVIVDTLGISLSVARPHEPSHLDRNLFDRHLRERCRIGNQLFQIITHTRRNRTEHAVTKVFSPVHVPIFADYFLVPDVLRIVQFLVLHHLKKIGPREMQTHCLVAQHRGQIERLHIHREPMLAQLNGILATDK